MKIAICAQGNNMKSNVDLRFGRTAFFAVYDDAADQWDFAPNSQNMQAAQGAGIQAAQAVIDAGAEVLIASNVGPKAMAALNVNSIRVFEVEAGVSLEHAVFNYKSGYLKQMQQSNVEGHWV